MKKKDIYRILDANFNRSREGLRVCEEITRFVMDDAALTRSLKRTRHFVSECLKNVSIPVTELVAARNVRSDVGKTPSKLEVARKDAFGLFLANAQRAKESLRVLEEISKLVDDKISSRLKKARFNVYAIEKRALSKLETLRHH